MLKKVAVLAPHPDDETLGCGGTILKLLAEGYHVTWIICTEAADPVYLRMQQERNLRVAQKYGFSDVISLHFPTTTVDSLPFGEVVARLKGEFSKIRPEILFLPYIHDAHTDHQVLTKAALNTCKWFRNPDIRKIYFYETLSETDFQLNPAVKTFRPNTYVDITAYYPQKREIMCLYNTEIDEPPFPRSLENIDALCTLRGSQSGFRYAEAFELVWSLIS